MFVLGNEAREQSKKSIKALISYVKTEQENSHQEIYVVLNCKQPLVKENEYSHTPRIIPLTHKLHRIGEKALFLITKEPVLYYREELTKKGLPTEDVFNEIISYNKAKLLRGSLKKLMRVFKENDLVLADVRINKKLPDVLGAKFYRGNKKVPFVIQMSKPIVGKRTHGKTDVSVDPKYVRSQVKSILSNASFIPPASGNTMTILVGYADWKVLEILDNINDVVVFLLDKKFLPVGGLVGKVENFNSIHLKTSDSTAMPIWQLSTNHQQ